MKTTRSAARLASLAIIVAVIGITIGAGLVWAVENCKCFLENGLCELEQDYGDLTDGCTVTDAEHVCGDGTLHDRCQQADDTEWLKEIGWHPEPGDYKLQEMSGGGYDEDVEEQACGWAQNVKCNTEATGMSCTYKWSQQGGGGVKVWVGDANYATTQGTEFTWEVRRCMSHVMPKTSNGTKSACLE